MGGKSGGGSQTVTQKSDPWSGQQGYLSDQFAQAKNLYDSGQLAPSYYSGQTVANQSPYTQQAISSLANQATGQQAQGLSNAAIQQTTDTINGKYLDPQNNPYYQGYINNAADAYARGTAAQTDSAFNRSGAYGGSAYQEAQGANNKAFTDSLNDLGNTQYQQGRQQQIQATAMAPTVNSLPYANIAQLANAGGQQDAYSQSQIDSNVNKYNYNANLPSNALRNYVGLTGGTYGGSSTQTSPTYQNTAANTLGGAISGGVGAAGLMSAFPAAFQGAVGAAGPMMAGSLSAFGGPIGIGLGALAGGLLSRSDMRIKENITYTGHVKDIPTYNFTYRGDPHGVVYNGVMAQDVMHSHPYAVKERNGVYMVDYGALGIEMRQLTQAPTIH